MYLIGLNFDKIELKETNFERDRRSRVEVLVTPHY